MFESKPERSTEESTRSPSFTIRLGARSRSLNPPILEWEVALLVWRRLRGGWYRQGGSLGSLVSDNIVGKGYAEAASTLKSSGTNCQDVTAAETMMMVKEHFIETFGPPLFTFGRGGSGGAYQQLQIADNYPGLLDGIIPDATFPEVLETTSSCRMLNCWRATSIPPGNH